MKKLLLATVLLAGALTAMPYITGLIAENATRDIGTRINSSSGNYGILKILEYQRGYRTSKIDLQWTPPIESSSLVGNSIEFSCEGKHGFLSYAYQCHANDGDTYSQFIEEYLGGSDPIALKGEVSINGRLTQHVEIQPFVFENKQAQQRLEADRANFKLVSEDKFESFTITGRVGNVSLADKDAKASLKNTSLRSDFLLNKHKMPIGKVLLTTQFVNTKHTGGEDFQLTGITLDVGLSESGDDLQASSHLAIEEILQTSLAGNDSSNWQDFSMKFGLSGLNMLEFVEFNKLMKQARQQTSHATRSGEAKSDDKANLLSLLPKFEGLLAKGLTVESEVGAQISEELLALNLRVELLNNLRFGDYLLMRIQPGALVAKFKAQYSASIPYNAFSNPNHNLTTDSPWYDRVGNRSESEVQVLGEDIVLNGKKISPRALLKLIFK